MKLSKLFIISLLAGMFSLSGLAPLTAEPAKPLRVLCGVYPVYIFAKNVTAGRENLQLELMLSPDLGCPHDYALKPADMRKIAAADVFLANGLGLEEFLGAPLKRANPKIALIDCSQGVKALQATPEPGSKDKSAPRDAYNPHIFASPAEAALMVRNLAEGLAGLDPEGAALYRGNAAKYAAKLEALAESFQQAGTGLAHRKIVTEHEIFDYLARLMGLEIVAVIEESPGASPSAAKMASLIKLIRSSGAAAVFTEPQYPAKVGRTIAAEAKVPVAELDPAASGPAEPGLNYYELVMQRNLEVLKEVLGAKSS